MPPASPPVAAIDLGTNTVLMLIARLDAAGRLEVLEDQCHGPRLGAGLAATGRLSAASVARTLEVLDRYSLRLDAAGIPGSRRRVVSTAVLRRAADAAEFVAAVRERTGLEVEILPEQEEARIGYRAVVGAGGDPETLVVDVGGGSTEIVGSAGSVRLSAPIGAVVLTETYLGSDGAPPTAGGGWPALERHVAAAVETFPTGLALRPGQEPLPAVCLGGTASNLACLDQNLAIYDQERAEGHVFATAVAGDLARRLSDLSIEDRRKLPIEPDRAAILPAGLACIAASMARIGVTTARVSGKGLRYGVARELLGA